MRFLVAIAAPAAFPASADMYRWVDRETGAVKFSLRQQIQAYYAITTELDRRDPAGRARRRAQDGGVLERIRLGLQ